MKTMFRLYDDMKNQDKALQEMDDKSLKTLASKIKFKDESMEESGPKKKVKIVEKSDHQRKVKNIITRNKVLLDQILLPHLKLEKEKTLRENAK